MRPGDNQKQKMEMGAGWGAVGQGQKKGERKIWEETQGRGEMVEAGSPGPFSGFSG